MAEVKAAVVKTWDKEEEEEWDKEEEWIKEEAWVREEEEDSPSDNDEVSQDPCTTFSLNRFKIQKLKLKSLVKRFKKLTCTK